MKQKEVDFKSKFKNSVFYTNDFYVKLCFTILFIAIFIVSFFSFGGVKYFYSTAYADSFKGYNFQIHAIDVGHGDCFLIKLPNDESMLIDAGKENNSLVVCEYINQFLSFENLKQIDYFVLTHADSDHIGGAKNIINNFKVANLLRPPVYSVTESQTSYATEDFETDEGFLYDEVIMRAYEKGVSSQYFYQGMTIQFGDCKLEFLSPQINAKGLSSNNYSGVMMFHYQAKKFLFMGDAEEEIEKGLINKYGTNLKADVLKVGHHGSATSSSKEFLELVAPEYAIISSEGNSSYFPDFNVVQNLKNSDSTLLPTYEFGNLVVSIKNDEIIYAKAQRLPNYLALIFAVVLIFVLIIWENPIKKDKKAL